MTSRHSCISPSFRAGASRIALLAAAMALGTAPAFADGGTGGILTGSAPGLGGIDGTLDQAVGSDGVFIANSSPGGTPGGGAVDLTTGNGAHGGARGVGGIGQTEGAVLGAPGTTGAAGLTITTATSIDTSIAGGAGGAGQSQVNNVNTTGGGGGGGVGVTTSAAITIAGSGSVIGGAGHAQRDGGAGGGGAGVFSTAQVTVEAGGQVTGGAGGGGVNGVVGAGGAGMGIILASGGGLANSGTITGGAGGKAGATVVLGGGGDGGAGVWLTGGGTVVNEAGGAIVGGVGGDGRFKANGMHGGLGGEGVKGGDITLINAGTIAGAMGGANTGGAAPVLADAVTFLGGVNSLEIQAGSVITGNVVAFSAADTLRLGGAADSSFDVSQIGPAARYQGFGIYEKTGASAWTLTGATTAATPWTISQGTLKISSDANLGDASSALAFNGGTLENTAAFATARDMTVGASGGTIQTDADLTLSGTVGGAGTLTKTGSANLILTGNAATSRFVVAEGMVQLGDGAVSGALSGDVSNDGALAFNRTDAIAFDGQISGSGSVAQVGSGTVTLSAANSYTGGTTISGGTLTGSATSFGTGAIRNDAGLVIDQPANADFANALDGTGTLTKDGAGRLNYTGTGTLSGAVTVADGTLAVNGSLANASIAVMGGSLGGNGTVGATIVQSGGAIAPGNSIGTLHVNGAFTADAGSVYQLEVDPNTGASDLILVNGAATIANGASVQVIKYVAGDFRPGARYTILTASGGVTGAYDAPAPISQYLGFSETQDANNLYLDVVQTGDPATAAQTGNQQAVAGGIPAGGAIGTGILNSQSEADARDAFDKLSGEAIASTRGALVSGSLLVRDTALDRLRDVCAADEAAAHPGCLSGERPLVWVQGFGNWGRIGGNANAAALSHTTGGFLIGTDVPVHDWRLGFFGGYSRTDFKADARSSWGSSDTYHLGTYAGTNLDGLALRLGAGYSWSALSTERLVAFGSFANDLTATYSAGTAQIFGEVAERFAFDTFNVEPFANLSYLNLRTAAFREGGGEAALSSQANTQEDTFATIGLRPSTEFSFFSLPLALKGMAGWRHTFGAVTPAATVSFAGGAAFTVTGAPIARDAGVVEAGLSANLTGTAAVNLTYGAQFGGRESNNGIRGTLAIAF